MCRFAAYLGHPILLSKLLTEPCHSIIHQSYHAEERREPLNGDGFGVAWYVPDEGPDPALFKEVTPAWNNDNLRELARVTRSPCILAHVRAASPGLSVQRLNCHPFTRGSLSFMHNGSLAGFSLYRRKLVQGLSDASFEALQGTTDSEHAFAMICDSYARDAALGPLQRLEQALLECVRELERLRQESRVTEPSMLNFLLSDGAHLVACRYGSLGDDSAASLYFTTGGRLLCENNSYRMEQASEGELVVVVASEKLTPDFAWTKVPGNHLVLACPGGQTLLKPMVGEGLPALPHGGQTTKISR